MSLYEFYSKLGGDYDDVLSRLISEERIKYFIFRFLDDDNFNALYESLNNKNYNQAFHSAHNLKGFSKNLGFIRLADSTDKISEALRPQNENDYKIAHFLIDKVTSDYHYTISAIKSLPL